MYSVGLISWILNKGKSDMEGKGKEEAQKSKRRRRMGEGEEKRREEKRREEERRGEEKRSRMEQPTVPATDSTNGQKGKTTANTRMPCVPAWACHRSSILLICMEKMKILRNEERERENVWCV